jgi:hypothetical protein
MSAARRARGTTRPESGADSPSPPGGIPNHRDPRLRQTTGAGQQRIRRCQPRCTGHPPQRCEAPQEWHVVRPEGVRADEKRPARGTLRPLNQKTMQSRAFEGGARAEIARHLGPRDVDEHHLKCLTRIQTPHEEIDAAPQSLEGLKVRMVEHHAHRRRDDVVHLCLRCAVLGSPLGRSGTHHPIDELGQLVLRSEPANPWLESGALGSLSMIRSSKLPLLSPSAADSARAGAPDARHARRGLAPTRRPAPQRSQLLEPRRSLDELVRVEVIERREASDDRRFGQVDREVKLGAIAAITASTSSRSTDDDAQAAPCSGAARADRMSRRGRRCGTLHHEVRRTAERRTPRRGSPRSEGLLAR